MKKAIILGSTGSIGQTAMIIMRNLRDIYTVVGLSAHVHEQELLDQANEFNVKALCLSGRKPLSHKIKYQGANGLLHMIEETEADILLNGIPGSDGLRPSIKAIETGKDLALANKETLVMAGPLIKELARKYKKHILPVDSEHSAIFQLLRKMPRNTIEEIVLTASGGAFRDTPIEDLKNVTLNEALVHPTWSMGQKITIDSATMANKGLEVIEAKELFSLDVSQIKVVIHPQSYVHSFVRSRDGALYAQISRPNMGIAIQTAFTYPDIHYSNIGRLDLFGATFTFLAPDKRKYPMLELGYEAATKGGDYPIAYNAANELAVSAFAHGRISFLDIPNVVRYTMEKNWNNHIESFDQVFALDEKAKRIAHEGIVRIGR